MADLAAETEGEAGPQLSVGVLTADLTRLGEELNILEGTGCWAHVDVMDGALCPQLTVGAPLAAAVASTGLPVDAHLMVHEPLKILPEIVAAGVSVTAPARLRWLARHRPDILRRRGFLGRNVFQSDDPVAMIQAVSAIVHDPLKPQDAFDQYVRKER